MLGEKVSFRNSTPPPSFKSDVMRIIDSLKSGFGVESYNREDNSFTVMRFQLVEEQSSGGYNAKVKYVLRLGSNSQSPMRVLKPIEPKVGLGQYEARFLFLMNDS